jgi:hypothetical protein
VNPASAVSARTVACPIDGEAGTSQRHHDRFAQGGVVFHDQEFHAQSPASRRRKIFSSKAHVSISAHSVTHAVAIGDCIFNPT